MSRAHLSSAEQLQHALQLRELSGPPLRVAAFKRELTLGRQVVCIHRDRPRGPCPVGAQEPIVLTVERIQTDLERGFVLQHPDGEVSHWLDGAPHAQA